MNSTGGGKIFFLTRDSAASWVSVCVLSTFSAPSQAPVLGEKPFITTAKTDKVVFFFLSRVPKYLFCLLGNIYGRMTFFSSRCFPQKKYWQVFLLPKWTHYNWNSFSAFFKLYIHTHIVRIVSFWACKNDNLMLFIVCLVKFNTWQKTFMGNNGDLKLSRPLYNKRFCFTAVA